MLRVLAPDAPFVVTFSDRCFPTKAVAIWQARGVDHGDLVSLYLGRAGFDRIAARQLLSRDGKGDPLWSVVGRKPKSLPRMIADPDRAGVTAPAPSR